MPVLQKPIPALYTVYILRSTVRHASLYIGSTPNPPRRLSQHNGEAKGGAARTSRSSLRPWEMVGLVSGFPGQTAALKFEWALANPHLSLHIPPSSRLTVSTAVKANGHPKRPRTSIMGVLSNLHLLLRVPSFARWPLKLHFFDAGVYATWQRWCATAHEPLRSSISVVTDFKPEAVTNAVDQQGETETSEEGQQARPWGIHALPLDYQPVKEHVAKGQAVFEFEREGDCVVCHKPIHAGAGLHVVCSNDGCEGVGHLLCWSRHMLLDNEADDILPIQGHCPKCKGEVLWGDMMKELTLRLRGGKDVHKLLKTRKRRAPKPKTASQAAEL